MNLLYFSAFRAVMLTGTVSAAAELLGRSQPAVSRLLDKLETELGVTLFERRRGLVTPTSVARLLLDEIERAFVSLDSLKSFAARVVEGESSRIDAAIMPALAIGFMPRLLAKFQVDWPKTRIVFHATVSARVEEWAASQQIDIGIAETPFRRSGFRIEHFSDAPYIAAVPSGHPLADKSRIEPADLVDVPFISWTTLTSAGQLVPQAFRSAGVRYAPAYETTVSAAVWEMVKNGIGVGLIDPYTAVSEVDERVRLIPFSPTIPFNVALLRPEARPANRGVEALLDLLASERDAALQLLPR
ncbi:Octopine catabolism/uptake operon regulatory protein OccR [Hyphomicrobiales bacterium]|nr:Octopine catabolism/uptake operon regulatory protein OccR [Hyphomicrobiales bacterium]CAH1698350.1 Octopine catabolism/uptake operon regulatory protein OccR [Hyphomicrobiales bacterium]CAI0342005.1 Octopine catabolism/uptake operon regulatory protein OccR [Hyphomicrobiales bacterium]